MSAGPASPSLKLVQLPSAADLPLPAYQTEGAAGLDLLAAVPEHEPLEMQPGAIAAVPTGLKMALPKGHEGQVRARSGLAIKHGITVINGIGTIDEDYRGEVHVGLINLGSKVFAITRGMRIAQLVVCPITRVTIEPVTELDPTPRGLGGFGSTGLTKPNG
ncbi:MAG: dUTP diphosphatase [Pseudomonadota bacterium]